MARRRIYTAHRVYGSFATATVTVPSCNGAKKELWYWIYSRQQLEADSERIDIISGDGGREEDAYTVAREER